jgi:hypothetical protein
MGPGVQDPVAPSIKDFTTAFFESGVRDIDNKVLQPTITADAQVTVEGDPGDNLAGWRFGFIQILRLETNWAYYRGQFNKHGSLFLQRGRCPGLTGRACLDKEEWPGFFYSKNSTTDPFQPTPVGFPVTVSVTGWNDAPGDDFRLREKNSLTGKVNFLREAQMGMLFCTLFSAQDPAGKLHHLAHFYWNVRWEARFQPADFTDPLGVAWHVHPTPGGNGRNVSHVFQGAPSDRRFMDVLLVPPVLTCNEISKRADLFVDGLRPDHGPPDLPPDVQSNRCRIERPVW